MEKSIRERVIHHLLEASDEQIASGELTAETSLREHLGLGSLEAVTLVMDLEQEFGIEIEDEELESLETVGDVLRLVEVHQQKG